MSTDADAREPLPPVLMFTEVARVLGMEAHARGWEVPAFRAPPSDPNVLRSIRRHERGSVVSVRIKDRPFEQVIVDMVEGVLGVNGLGGNAVVRAELLSSLTASLAAVRTGLGQ